MLKSPIDRNRFKSNHKLLVCVCLCDKRTSSFAINSSFGCAVNFLICFLGKSDELEMLLFEKVEGLME